MAELAIRRFGPVRVVVLADPGGNGGGGLAAARHLANRGRTVWVVLAGPVERLTPVPARQHDILARMGIPVSVAPPDGDLSTLDPELRDTDLIIDTLIGYSLAGAPTGPAAGLIRWANAHPAPVLTVDTPSGLDVTTGLAAQPCVRATATLTLALPKVGLLGAEPVGELFLADISVPAVVYQQLGIAVGDMFHDAGIVAVDAHGHLSR